MGAGCWLATKMKEKTFFFPGGGENNMSNVIRPNVVFPYCFILFFLPFGGLEWIGESSELYAGSEVARGRPKAFQIAIIYDKNDRSNREIRNS